MLFGAAYGNRSLLDYGTTSPVLNNPLLGGMNGFRVEHYGAGQMRVAGADDVNADSSAGNAGSVYLLLGRDFGLWVDIAGDAGNNILVGPSADEALLGAAGNDLIDGDAGSDTLLGGPQRVTVSELALCFLFIGRCVAASAGLGRGGP